MKFNSAVQCGSYSLVNYVPRAERDKGSRNTNFLPLKEFSLVREIEMETNHNSPVIAQQTRYKYKSSERGQIRFSIMSCITSGHRTLANC